LKLLSHIYLRAFVVDATFVFVQALAYSISPSVGDWAVRSTLQTLFALSYAGIVLVLPFIVFLAIVLRAVLLLPTRLAYLIMMIPNQETKGVALATYTDQLKLRLRLMSREAAEKMSKNDTLIPIVAFLSQRTALGIFLLIVVVVPIMEELEYRYLYDYMRAKLAHLLRFTDRDGTALKVSTAIGSFIFACAHISNWVPVSSSINAATLMDTNVNTAILVSFAAIVQVFSSFFISQRILFPVYQERGLAASIGAHATWNAFIFTTRLQVPIRLFVRAWNRLRR
jgi:membrane protease YdiL (CAAX protease family)